MTDPGYGVNGLQIDRGDQADMAWSVQLGQDASSAVRGVTITVSRSLAGAYSCSMTGGDPTAGWKDSYAPASCEHS